jgi:uncharacterized protein YxjI
MPVEVYCEVCRKPYPLKDEFAGKKVKCPTCQTVLDVPARSKSDDDERESRPGFPEDLTDEFWHDKFLLRQKLWSIKEKYSVADERGRPILFVERPIHFLKGCLALVVGIPAILILAGGGAFAGIALEKSVGKEASVVLAAVLGAIGFLVGLAIIIALYPKRHITFYPDESKQDMLLRIFQEQKVAFINMRYTLADDTGTVLCVFRKNFIHGILRKRWYIESKDGETLFVVKEDSVLLSLLRRTVGAVAEEIPLLGLALVAFLRTNFIFTRVSDGETVGEFNRRMTLLDRYVLDLTMDEGRKLDRRIAVAMGVLLDTGERR